MFKKTSVALAVLMGVSMLSGCDYIDKLKKGKAIEPVSMAEVSQELEKAQAENQQKQSEVMQSDNFKEVKEPMVQPENLPTGNPPLQSELPPPPQGDFNAPPKSELPPHEMNGGMAPPPRQDFAIEAKQREMNERSLVDLSLYQSAVTNFDLENVIEKAQKESLTGESLDKYIQEQGKRQQEAIESLTKLPIQTGELEKLRQAQIQLLKENENLSAVLKDAEQAKKAVSQAQNLKAEAQILSERFNQQKDVMQKMLDKQQEMQQQESEENKQAQADYAKLIDVERRSMDKFNQYREKLATARDLDKSQVVELINVLTGLMDSTKKELSELSLKNPELDRFRQSSLKLFDLSNSVLLDSLKQLTVAGKQTREEAQQATSALSKRTQELQSASFELNKQEIELKKKYHITQPSVMQ